MRQNISPMFASSKNAFAPQPTVFQYHVPSPSPIPFYIHDSAVIIVATNYSPRRRKFIEVKNHHLHNTHDDHRINIRIYSSQKNLADFFPEPLFPQKYAFLNQHRYKSSRPPPQCRPYLTPFLHSQIFTPVEANPSPSSHSSHALDSRAQVCRETHAYAHYSTPIS